MSREQMLRLIPLLLLFVLVSAMALGLFAKPAVRLSEDFGNGKPFPEIELPALMGEGKFTPEIFEKGRVVIVNVFASWCKPCAAEHDKLLELAKNVRIYGIAWKDTPENAALYLQEKGNPYQQIGVDEQGVTTVPLALTGVPETFIIDKRGKVVMHYKTAIDDAFIKRILPVILRLNREKI